MDPFEPIRAAAADLHSAAVVAGCDPLNPAALAAAAIERLALEVVYLPAADPALKGARALLDEQSGTICCESGGDPVDRALLLAHEVGHARIHAGSAACGVEDIDPSRSSEAVPVGLQRVEDYGARERRELQADVFAREFVLPRVWARRLHIREGLGATGIATRTGLPLALVRQQLFDALLLPPPPAESATTTTGTTVSTPRPDSSQDRAVRHRGAPFQLQSGPGTGKTRTLVRRVSALLAEGVDPAAILVVTFSNRAAGELATRLAAVAPEAARRLWIGTIHAFGLELVRRHHDRLNLPPNPQLFDRSDAIEAMEEVLPTLPLLHYRNLWDPAIILRDIVAAIARAKDELVDAAGYRALGQAMWAGAVSDVDRIAAEKCLEVASIFEIYERTLRKRDALDFGDLIMRPALLLESDPAVAQTARLRHRHLLVDEYQDVNRASARLLRAVAGDGERLWVVGDARQAIYRFRGASATNVAHFGMDYAGAVFDQLEINYRSTVQIVDSVVAVGRRMGVSADTLPSGLTAERGRGPKPQIHRYETPEDEAQGVAAGVLELESSGVAFGKQAVLCRSNSRVNEMAAALEARGIPVLHLGSLFEREEVRDLLALLSLIVEPVGDGLLRVAALPRYGVNLQDIRAAVLHLRSTGQRTLDGLESLAGADGVSRAGAAAFTRLAVDLAGLDPAASAWELLSSYLLDRTDYVRELAQKTTVKARMRAIGVWQFLNFVRGQSPRRPGRRVQRTLDRVRQLVLLAEERDLRQVPVAALHLDAVRLMTVHGSKGLEFEAVHVPGLTKGSFPTTNRWQRCPAPVGMVEGAEGLSVADEARRSHENEEECLFFVALSRARNWLRLYLARRRSNGNRLSASPFLTCLPPGVVDNIEHVSTVPTARHGGGQAAVVVRRRGKWCVTDSELGSYERCPRRFFYTHILELRAARKRTAFTQTHDCLYAFMRWLAGAREKSEPTVAEAEKALERIWQAQGPVNHAFCADYRRLASRLVSTLLRAGKGRGFRKTKPLTFELPNGRVIVEPSELAEGADGRVVVRRVRTGKTRVNEYDRLEYALYRFAADEQFGSRAVVEALHLTDANAESVAITARKLASRRAKSNSMLGSIAAGVFPPQPDPVTCPRCPHFFICPSVPEGALTLP